MDRLVYGELSFGMADAHLPDARTASRTVGGSDGTGIFAFDGVPMVCGGVLYVVCQNAKRLGFGCNSAFGLYSGSRRGTYADRSCVHSADYDLSLYGADSAYGDDDGRQGRELVPI